MVLLSGTQSNTRLERTRRERASLLSCVGEPLKRIYKASQEKKSVVNRGVPMVLFFAYCTPDF